MRDRISLLALLGWIFLFVSFQPAANTIPIRPIYDVGELSNLCQNAITEANQRLEAISSIPKNDRTLENTLLAFENSVADFDAKTGLLTFMNYVSPVKATATESTECEEKTNQFLASLFTRKELYLVIRDTYLSMRPIQAIPDAIKRLFSETIKKFERNGMHLPDAELQRVKDLNETLATLSTQFSNNLNTDTTTLEFTLDELQGASKDFLARLEKTPAGKYRVTTKNPDYFEVIENVQNSETRHKMLFAYENRAATQNTAFMEQAIRIRQELASILGYPTWADYQQAVNMAKNAKTVLQFLTNLKEKLKERNKTELAQLLRLKQEQDPTATELKPWDIRYFSNQLKKRDYNFDKNAVRAYFPADTVIRGMFDVYARLLGIQLTSIQDTVLWAPNVHLYGIKDAESGRLIGYFYADLFPRAGKYGHAAAFSLIKGRKLEDGSYHPTVSAMVANFNPPTADKPALLSHEDVETLFHEFGHIMHQTLTQAPYSSLSGTAVAIDFVEAPSQMLENWVWSPEILAVLSGHYQRPEEKLPTELLDKMLRARDFNQGYFYTRQLLFGLLDMEYHTTKSNVDTTEVYNRLYQELFGITPMEGGHFSASFGHLMGGYDAGYYGYLWSEVYSEDMFTRFQTAGLLNSTVGLHYRRAILEKGNMVDAIELLREFLGRDPSTDAFFKRLKIE